MLSPLLFALFIADLPVFLARNGCEGVKLQDGPLNSLWYADDGALLAASPPSLQQTLDSLAQYCDRWRLCVNMHLQDEGHGVSLLPQHSHHH